MVKTVLDACCGSRMFWFDRSNSRAVFLDNRNERHSLTDNSHGRKGSRSLVIEPDTLGDFTALPFPDNHFSLVVFDPPHLKRAGRKGWMAKKYGRLSSNWPEVLRLGFAQCFRVLKPEGVLVFKWSETNVTVSQVLSLTPEVPLFGNRSGKRGIGHWIVFMKTKQKVAE